MIKHKLCTQHPLGNFIKYAGVCDLHLSPNVLKQLWHLDSLKETKL